MKDGTKIIIGFFAIVFLVFVQLGVVYKLQNNILKNIVQIQHVEEPLGLMVRQIIAYDAILTSEVHTALLEAQSGDYENLKAHEQRYRDASVKLDDLLKKDIKILLRQSQQASATQNEVLGYNKAIDEYNRKLVDLETGAFAALNDRDPGTAYSLVVGEDYKRYKTAIASLYQNWEKIERREAVAVGDNAVNDSKKNIFFNLAVSILIIVVLLAVLMLIRLFLVEQYRLYRALFQSTRDDIMTLKSPKWNFTSGNNAAFRIFGVKNEKEFSSLGPSDLSPEKQPDGQLSSVKAKKMIEKALKNGSAFFEWTHKKYKGKDFKATVLLSRVDVKGGAYLQATVRDVNEQRKMLKG